MSNALVLKRDRLAIIAGAGAALSMASLMARIADKRPAGPAAIIVLIGATIGFRVALSYAAKSASAPTIVDHGLDDLNHGPEELHAGAGVSDQLNNPQPPPEKEP